MIKLDLSEREELLLWACVEGMRDHMKVGYILPFRLFPLTHPKDDEVLGLMRKLLSANLRTTRPTHA